VKGGSSKSVAAQRAKPAMIGTGAASYVIGVKKKDALLAPRPK